MAIGFDNSSSGFVNTSGPLTVSHTCGGSNRILLVGVEISVGGETVTGVTYNSVAMTQINVQDLNGSTFRNTYLFYLIAPATGANSIVVSASGGTGNVYAAAASYTGVDQSNPLDVNAAVNNTSVTALAGSLSLGYVNDWIVGFASMNPNGTLTAGANTTVRQLVDVWGGFLDTAGPQAGGSQSVNVNRNASGQLGLNIVGIKEVGASPFVAVPSRSLNINQSVTRSNTF